MVFQCSCHHRGYYILLLSWNRGLVSTHVRGKTRLHFPVALGWMQKSSWEPEQSPALKRHQTLCFHEKDHFCQANI